MKVTFYPFNLQFKKPFGLSVGSRTHTPVVFVEIEENGITGYGEAALPPYLEETQESVSAFVAGLDLSASSIHSGMEALHILVENHAPGNNSAKAAVDIALHDLWGKTAGKSLSALWNSDTRYTPLCTYTIGIGDKGSIIGKIRDGKDFHMLKVKLGSPDDKEIIRILTGETDKPFCVDVNQGWTDKHFALDMIGWLHEKGVVLVEQPLPKILWDDMAWITERSPVPTIGDEAIRRLSDIDLALGSFNGINIKLMKSTGLFEARQMIEKAKQLNLKILIGCMSESSCGVSAAAHLSPFADWADLDGPYLISNDPFAGMTIEEGRIRISTSPGIGISRR